MPISSQAAVTLGSDLATEPTTSYGCTNAETNRGCLFVQDVLPGRQLVSPFDGVIVRWRVRLGNDTKAQEIRLRLVRQVDATHFTAVSSGPLEPVNTGAGSYEFPTQLPIRSGDQIGGEPGTQDIEWGAMLAGAHAFWYNPPPPDGGTTVDPIPGLPDVQLTYNVDVEPDCDHDGLGDETQDANLSSCPPSTIPPPVPGTATATCRGLPATIVGTEGNDVRTGSQGQDVIVGLGGNDKLSGLAGNDVICGGKGSDTLKGGAGKDQLSGQKGKDRLYGQKGNDKLSGKAGNDTLKGGPGKDVLKGGAGKDKQVQ